METREQKQISGSPMFPATAKANIFNRGGEFVKLYRGILVEARKFWDDRTRAFIIHHTRKRFRTICDPTDKESLNSNLRKARQYLHALEKANAGEHKAVMRELEMAYGRRGVIRHWLLQPFLSYVPEMRPQPLIPSRPITSRPPPLLSPPLAVILGTYHHKTLEPTLPVLQYKPLARSRQVNIRHDHRMKLLNAVEAPLPEILLRELEMLAGGHLKADAELVGWELYQKESEKGPPKYPSELMHLITPRQDLIPISRVRHVENPLTNRQRRRFFQNLLKTVPVLVPYPTSIAMLLDNKCRYRVSASKYAGKGELPSLTELDREGVAEGAEKMAKKVNKAKKNTLTQ